VGAHQLRRRSNLRHVVLAACLGLVVAWLLEADRADATAFSLLGKQKKKNKIVWKKQLQGQELLVKTGWPFFSIQKIPPKRVVFDTASAMVETTRDDVLQFPFRTDNKAKLSIAFPRMDGRLGLSFKDPVLDLDSDEIPHVLEVDYTQKVPKVGQVTGRLSSEGDWGLVLNRDVKNVGKVRGEIDSDSEWAVDLLADYPSIRGITPQVRYGLTQDGARVAAKLSAPLTKKAKASYAVANNAGNYKVQDLSHDLSLDYAPSTSQKLRLQAAYNNQLGKPLQASATYVRGSRDAQLSATATLRNYNVKAWTRKAEVGMTLNHEGGKPVGSPTFDMRVGKVVGGVQLNQDKSPTYRLGIQM